MLALLFVGLRSRPSKPVDAERGMADLERFRQAMTRPLPPMQRRARRPGADPHDDEVYDQESAAGESVAPQHAPQSADAEHPSGRSAHRRSA
jgi:hypothetical protein